MVKGSHKRDDVINLITQIVTLTDEDLKEYKNNPKVMMIYKEFKDWIQTYTK